MTAKKRQISEMSTFHRDVAIATADLNAAEAYLRRTFSQLFDAAEAGTVTDAMRLDGRLSTSHTYVVAMRVAQTAFASATTTAIRNGNIIQRVFRDIHAGNAHFLTAEQSLIDSGKVIAGVDGAALVF